MAGMIASRACLAWASESPSGCSSIAASSRSVDRLKLVDRRDQLAQVGRLDLGDSRAGGLEAGDRLGDLGLVAQRGRQDHPLGDLDRQLRLDVDRLAVALDEDLVPRMKLALVEDAVLREQLDRLGRDQVGKAVDRGPAVGQPAALGLGVPGLAVVVAVEDDVLALLDRVLEQELDLGVRGPCRRRRPVRAGWRYRRGSRRRSCSGPRSGRRPTGSSRRRGTRTCCR